MSDIEWIELPTDQIQPYMRVAPLASWTLDVFEVTRHGWVCMNLDTKRPTLYQHPRASIAVLCRNGSTWRDPYRWKIEQDLG